MLALKPPKAGEDGGGDARTTPAIADANTGVVGRRKRVLAARLALGNDFEVSVVRPPRALLGDLAPIFPALEHPQRLLIVPTVQKAQLDLAGVGPAVEDEKDRLLESFQDWARVVSARLAAGGHWVDFADPMTAMPALGPSGSGGCVFIAFLFARSRFACERACDLA
jgi:hypothetical protein